MHVDNNEDHEADDDSNFPLRVSKVHTRYLFFS